MYFDFAELSPPERYKLVTATVVPRPIALVSTRNENGTTNLAPFSFFNVFSEDPPLVVLGLQSKPDLTLKDTTANIRRTGEFAINLVDEQIARQMVNTAANFPPGESEADPSGLSVEQCRNIDVDYVSNAPIAFECRRVTVLQFASTRDLAIGEILSMHSRDGLIDPKTLYLNWEQYNPIGRLYADNYIRTKEIFTMSIPNYEDAVSGRNLKNTGEQV